VALFVYGDFEDCNMPTHRCNVRVRITGQAVLLRFRDARG
jgi:hypothetical protein